MDETFEEKQKALDTLPAAEYAKRIEGIKKTCKEFCGECPTYTGLGEKNFAFCMGGKSDIIKEENGCMCDGCPITVEFGMKWAFYCTRGKAKEQAQK